MTTLITDSSTTAVLPTVQEFLSQPKKLYIGGEWVDAASGRVFETLDPSTGEVLATAAYGQSEDASTVLSLRPGRPLTTVHGV